MASFDRIAVGQVLYQRKRVKMGNTSVSREAIYTVKVVEIDTLRRRAFVSWNQNPTRWWSESEIAKLLVNSPKPRKDPWADSTD